MDCPTPNKIIYVSRAEAKSFTKGSGSHLKAYKCPSGKHWHLSSMDKRLGRRMRKKVNARYSI